MTDADRRVYVVDDDDCVRDSLEILFQAYGLQVRSFAQARDFLAAMDAQTRGCLVLDMHMPDMDGLQLLAELQARGSRLPAVVLTGRTDATLRARALDLGARDLLDKAVIGEALVELVQRLSQE